MEDYKNGFLYLTYMLQGCPSMSILPSSLGFWSSHFTWTIVVRDKDVYLLPERTWLLLGFKDTILSDLSV